MIDRSRPGQREGDGAIEFTHRMDNEAALQKNPDDFVYHAKSFYVCPGVFSPNLFPSTSIFSDMLSSVTAGSFLEVGCGVGVIGIMAALRGCNPVLLVDLNPTAVENARRNVERHNVGDRAHVVQSDLFDACSTRVFDTIFWNSNFVFAPTTTPQDSWDPTYFDVGYAAHRRYLREGFEHLAPNGQLFLGFSSLGAHNELLRICQDLGMHPEVVATAHSAEDGSPSYSLLRMVQDAAS